MKIAKMLWDMAELAKRAASMLRLKGTLEKNEALQLVCEELDKNRNNITSANAQDLEDAKEKGLNEAMLDRLSIQKDRLDLIIADVQNVISLPDPVGEVFEGRVLPNGMTLQKKRVSIGVLGMIYEARPNVTVDVASLALKTGNAAILRGGKETLRTNLALAKALTCALERSNLPPFCIQLIPSKSRSLVKQMLQLDSHIDMIIPRGGSGLHRFCLENSTIPVITGGIGICHLFVDETADLEKSAEVIFNAKTQRPSVCNALDTLLVHEKVAPLFLPLVAARLGTKNVSYRLDDEACKILKPNETLVYKRASEVDWQTEWLSLVLGIKVIGSLQEAIEHIQKYSSRHSDGILTESQENADAFIQSVDSAAVYVNASTRFTDGGQFGLGAEVAISTQKLHARGPMGLQELTTYKWIAKGNYHVRKG